MSLDSTWFTEISEISGSAFSLKVDQKCHSEKTPYQQIDIYKTEQFGNLMAIDGFVMLTTRDNFLYHEMMTHPVIYTHTQPENVVIIGGGDCGTLQSVLRHDDIKEAWQIEIDERVTRLSEQYFPELCTANNDPRAHFYFGDGIQWMKDAAAESIDIIIIDSTDPVGPAEGLFSEPFYRDCLKALRPGGIIVQQSESPLIHISIIKPMHTAMKSAGFDQVQTLNFPQCVYPSGWWTCTMAGKQADLKNPRIEDIKNKSFKTQYYNAEIHLASMAMPEFMKRELNCK